MLSRFGHCSCLARATGGHVTAATTSRLVSGVVVGGCRRRRRRGAFRNIWRTKIPQPLSDQRDVGTGARAFSWCAPIQSDVRFWFALALQVLAIITSWIYFFEVFFFLGPLRARAASSRLVSLVPVHCVHCARPEPWWWPERETGDR